MSSRFRLLLIVVACGFSDRSLAIDIEVSRVTGEISLVNSSASPAPIAGYSIYSPSGALLPANWLSIADNYDSNSGGFVDINDTWAVIAANANSLAEGQIGGPGPKDGGVLTPGQRVSLGLAWDPFRIQDLTASILGASGTVPVTPIYTTFSADFDENLRVDRADLALWRICFISGCEVGDADGNQVVNGNDYLIWLQQAGSSGPIPPPGSVGMASGVGATATAIPEPTSLALAVVGLLAVLSYYRIR